MKMCEHFGIAWKKSEKFHSISGRLPALKAAAQRRRSSAPKEWGKRPQQEPPALAQQSWPGPLSEPRCCSAKPALAALPASKAPR